MPFYDTPANGDLVKNVKAPIMLQFAENDKRVNATWPDYEAILKANNVNYTAHFYLGTQHGFHNDSTSRYDPKATELAWSRSLDIFKQHLASLFNQIKYLLNNEPATLAGEVTSIPQAFAGQNTLLLFDYVHKSQFDIDRWLIGLDQTNTQVATYEIPTKKAYFHRSLVP